MLIGIAGGSGAGKTTVAQQVTEDVADVHVLPLDNYYRDRSTLPPEERARINYDHPDAFDWELVRDHLDSLESGDHIEMPQYDFEAHCRTDETVHVDPAPVVVIEGILALYDDAVRERLDLRLYVETDADVRVLRRIQRDVEERGRDLSGVIDQYLSTVKPMHEQFVRPTKRHAHLVIPEGANEKAVELLRNRID
ncbi:uridine kinase [Natronomonas amylolytica]|uniref:uridine kinase n=1 Tax=Natronomonas amylolytica TaxID=3108498 RepID=UPI00300979CA